MSKKNNIKFVLVKKSPKWLLEFIKKKKKQKFGQNETKLRREDIL